MAHTVEINGVSYPCRQTLGAMLLYKRETGRDLDASTGVSDMAVFFYCCVKSATNADGVDFPYDMQTFCDNLPLEALTAWSESFAAPAVGAKKKASA